MYTDNAKVFHSVNIGKKNTWDDWHLVPTSRPTFALPKLKQKTIEVPGASGVIDLSSSLTGYPLFSNRSGSFEFLVYPDYDEWTDVYSDIADYLRGQEFDCWLEDDPEFVYHGSFILSAFTSGSMYSTLTIEYSVEPYKYYRRNSVQMYGKYFKDLDVTTTLKDFVLPPELQGVAPVKPVINIEGADENADFTISYPNPRTKSMVTRTAKAGSGLTFPDFILCGKSFKGTTFNDVDYKVQMKVSSGTAKVSFVFNPGRL